MPTPGLGHKSYIQIGKETTWGTAVAATQKFECISFDVSPDIGSIADPSLYAQASRRAFYQGGIKYVGKITVRANYEGLLKLFQGVFGGAVTTGAGPFTHTFKEALLLPSYTIELIEGDIGTGLEQELVGAKFTSMSIKTSAGSGADGMMTIELGVVAKDKVVGQTPTGALSFPAVLPILFHQMTTITEGSGDTAANVRVTDFECSIDNKLALDRFYLGNLNIDEPIRNDFLDIKFKLTQEFVTTALFVKAKAFTQGALNFVWTLSTRSFTLRSNQCTLMSYSNPVENYGIITAKSEWAANFDVTDASALVAIMIAVTDTTI